MTDVGDVSTVLGMNVAHDHEKGTITIDQRDYTGDIVERFGMKACDPVFTPETGRELSLYYPEHNLLDKEGKRRYQPIVGGTMYLAQVSRYDVPYAVNQLARRMPKPLKAHMGAAKHLLRYLTGSTDFFITYKQGRRKLAAFSDTNGGNIPDNGKSKSSYIGMLANGPISFKVGLQSLTAQSTMESELVEAALTMEDTVFCTHDERS